MLNKTVCSRCYSRHLKAYSSAIFDIELLERFFVEDWEKGICRCKATGATEYFMVESFVPTNCPYTLEHVVEGQRQC
jgi:ribosomal protein L40E